MIDICKERQEDLDNVTKLMVQTVCRIVESNCICIMISSYDLIWRIICLNMYVKKGFNKTLSFIKNKTALYMWHQHTKYFFYCSTNLFWNISWRKRVHIRWKHCMCVLPSYICLFHQNLPAEYFFSMLFLTEFIKKCCG